MESKFMSPQRLPQALVLAMSLVALIQGQVLHTEPQVHLTELHLSLTHWMQLTALSTESICLLQRSIGFYILFPQVPWQANCDH